MESSVSIKEIALALSNFQGEVANPKNTATNPSFNSKYAPLSEVINTIKDGLARNGLSIVQNPYTDGDNVIVETILLHNSGEWLKAPPLSLKMDTVTAQGAGSAITYARRYAISAILNISSEEDNDGNEIKTPEEEMITDRQIKYIHVLAKEKEIDNATLKDYSISKFGKDSMKELTKLQASKFIEDLNAIKTNDQNPF